ncbi:MAG: Asp23/Gls24 family envelope stress response protein [Clostridiales bacterium]|nr:Asp23/Gls24 family envelope stress response protein [Clostridiales bacterium]
MSKMIQGPWGMINISREVIAKLAGIATTECFGIVGMVSSHKFSDGITELLGREALSKGVEVAVRDDRLLIRVNVVMSYGMKISVIADNVIERVRYTVESHIETQVDLVEVNVRGIRVVD